MSLDQATIHDHFNTLNNLLINGGTQAAKQSAIEAYYNYLASEDVAYAPLALQVATDTGGFGQFANDILTQGGFGNKIDDVKLGLATQDASQREDTFGTQAGVLTPRNIADYHYSVYDANSIPRAAWGGAFFEEFVGTGSWITLATSGIPSGDMAAALELLYDDIRSDQPNSNGVDIGDAAAYLADAVSITDLGQAAFTLNVAAGGALNVSMTSPTATLPAAFAALQLKLFSETVSAIDAVADLADFAGTQLRVAGEGVLSLFTTQSSVSEDVLTSLAQTANELGQSTVTVETAVGSTNYGVYVGGSGADVLSLSTSSYIALLGDGDDWVGMNQTVTFVDGGAGGDTISYSNVAAGVKIDLSAGQVRYVADNSLKDTILSFEHAEGTQYNDIIIGTSGNNSLNGGAGVDTMQFSGGYGHDVVSQGEQIVIDSTTIAGIAQRRYNFNERCIITASMHSGGGLYG